jgi:hypothetical protein
MDYETIKLIEESIKSLNDSKKEHIARNLVSDPNYQISRLSVSNNVELIIEDKTSGSKYQFLNYVNAKCNC